MDPMTVFEFISSLIGSLAWPTAILIALWLWKDQVTGVLSGDVRRFKAGPSGIELEFWEREADSIRESLGGEAAKPVTGAVGVDQVEASELIRLTEVAPAGAILEAYSRIEFLLAEVVGPESEKVSGRRLLNLAANRELISPSVYEAIQSLITLRNAAAHPRSDQEGPTSAQAIEFLMLADWVLRALGTDG